MNLPPKSLKQQVIRPDNGKTTGTKMKPITFTKDLPEAAPLTPPTPVSSSPADLPAAPAPQALAKRTPDSLPVLEAFQEFLDIERRRLRKRLALTVAAYFAFFLCLLLGGFYVGLSSLNNIQTDMDRIRRDFDTVRNDALRASSRTDEANRRFVEESRKWREEFAAEAQAASNRAAQAAAPTNDTLGKLRDMAINVTILQTENAALKEKLAGLETMWPPLVNRMNSLLAEVQKIREYPPAASPPAAPEPPIAMSVTPRGASRPVEIRIPYPE